MPALGGLPRKTSLRTWSAPIPPTGILISSHVSCKPLTLLHNLVNSDVRTSASFQLNCSVTFLLTTRGRGHTVGKLFLGGTRRAVLTAESITEILNDMKSNANLTFIRVTVLSQNAKNSIFRSSLTRARQEPERSPECWITETCACTMNQGWVVSWWFAVLSFHFLLFFYLFLLVVPHPIRGSETWSFCVLSILFQSKMALCPFEANHFGLINVYRNVYSHGYQMFNLFLSH